MIDKSMRMRKIFITIFVLVAFARLEAEEVYTFNSIHIGSDGAIYNKTTKDPINGVVIISMSGEPIIELDVKEGKKYAEKHYYDTGELFMYIPFKNGKRDGISIEYYKDGVIAVRTVYKDGLKNGKREDYNEDRTLWSEVEYKNDIKDGIAREYKDGKVWIEKVYRNGKLVSSNYIDK